MSVFVEDSIAMTTINNREYVSHSLTATALLHVSTPLIFLTMVPLFFIAYVSWLMKLKLESPIVVGTIRTFVQLSILGWILDPIFVRGETDWWLVIGYAFLMVLLASYESTTRTKYYFHGMYPCILISQIISVTIVSLFTFCVILRPDPIWDPQYVIPIIGMLLGNCINGVSLSLNSMITSLVEEQREIELYLSFGANPYEATSRLLRDAVRIGATPQLNSMAIIGLVSIPGMMTGQILGGSPVVEAARYQILIIYLIAICSFGTILVEVYIALFIGFYDTPTTTTPYYNRLSMSRGGILLCTNTFIKRSETNTWLHQIYNGGVFLKETIISPFQKTNKDVTTQQTTLETTYLLDGDTSSSSTTTVSEEGASLLGSSLLAEKLEIYTLSKNTTSTNNNDSSSSSLNGGASSHHQLLEVRNLKHSFSSAVSNDNKRKEPDDSPPRTPILTTTPSDSTNNTTTTTSMTQPKTTSYCHQKHREKRHSSRQQQQQQQQPKGGTLLFHDLSFTVSSGEITAICGDSGVGKTTLLRIVAGLTPLDHGSLYLEGTDRSDYYNGCHHKNMCHWRQSVRYVTQCKVDIPGTPYDFINRITSFNVWKQQQQQRKQKEEITSLTSEILSNWNLKDVQNTLLASEWKSLSSGEAQRILLAIALATRPKVLLLDESTSALDYNSKLLVEQTIQEFCIKYQVAVLWITHDKEQLKRFKK